MAAGANLGVALLIALLYTPVVLLNLPLGIALWVVLVSVENLQVVSVGPLVTTLLIGVVWFGSLRASGSETLALVRLHRREITVVGLLLVWLTLSYLWADTPSLVWALLWQWLLAGLVFLVLATSLRTEREIQIVVVAFVVGTTLSVIIGLIANDFSSAETARQAAFDQGTRAQGGNGDPNFLAAGVVAALALVSGLVASRRGPLAGLALLVATFILAVGFAAAESRGALAGAAVAIVAALFVYSGRRGWVIAFSAFAVAASACWFVAYPDAWHRISHFNNEGNGREEYWRIAWEIGTDYPIAGVGLNNYLAVSPKYVRRPGSLKFVEIIADKPHVAHNTYLQLFAEAGVVGLALFLLVLAGSFRAAWLAGRRFDARGSPGLAALARAVLVASIGMACTSVFISNGGDKRLWILLALGPALAVAAERMPQSRGGVLTASPNMPTP
ncbi:MAG TPA: O-antigen ligase family protein [Thermoleophilaceae bacterium]|nr:O-antigen ligase family protein [Thermoleophilaceae bacterium]